MVSDPGLSSDPWLDPYVKRLASQASGTKESAQVDKFQHSGVPAIRMVRTFSGRCTTVCFAAGMLSCCCGACWGRSLSDLFFRPNSRRLGYFPLLRLGHKFPIGMLVCCGLGACTCDHCVGAIELHRLLARMNLSQKQIETEQSRVSYLQCGGCRLRRFRIGSRFNSNPKLAQNVGVFLQTGPSASILKKMTMMLSSYTLFTTSRRCLKGLLKQNLVIFWLVVR